MSRVVFVLTPWLHLLDLAGPAQVFSTAGGYELHYLAESSPVPTFQGVPLVAEAHWPVLRPADLVIVPGWSSRVTGSGGGLPGGGGGVTGGGGGGGAPGGGSGVPGGGGSVPGRGGGLPGGGGNLSGRGSVSGGSGSVSGGSGGVPGGGGGVPGGGGGSAGRLGPGFLERIAAHHAAGGTVASVCSGADALGRAGLLAGRRCTTHHDLQDELARNYPRATVIRDVLYVEDDRVITSAGIASGIDLALHLVAVRHGPAAAARVAREMVVYARRNGHEQQASAMLRHRAHLSEAVHQVQDRIDASFTSPLPLGELAADAGVSERTLTRLFATATGQTPLRYQQLLRVERAEYLIGHGATLESAARAVGFGDARMLRRLRSRA